MENNLNIQLNEAKKLYSSKKYAESLNIYEELFSNYSDEFKLNDLISYCWAVYQVHVKNFKNEDELFEAADLITELIPQADLNSTNTCPYTFAVMEVLKYLDSENQYYNMDHWFDKIEPKLLDENKNNSNFRSRKERFYEIASKAYLACAEWDLCIEVSDEALDSIKSFTNYGDIWHKWRIAKALRELDQNVEALEYLNEVAKVKDDWFIFKEFAENYYILNDSENAIKYLCQAILAKGPAKMKVNLYCFAFKLLEDSNEEIAYRHAELCYLLKTESNAQIPDELEDLMIEEETLNKKELIRQINSYWNDFKFQNQELQYGTITKFVEDRNFGFIQNENNESIFFHKSEFRGDNIYVGQLVSFYTEESFDRSKNEKSLKAVNIRGE